MQEKYIKINNLRVSKNLSKFVNDELLKNTNVSSKNFWLGLEKTLDDLAPKNKQLINNSSFIGYEIVYDFIFEAKKNYPNAEWKCSDKLARETDYLFISGTLNMAFNYSINEWQRYLESQIEECFIHVKKVLAFNLLFAGKRKIEKGLFYSEIDRVFDFCDKNLGNTVITKTPGTEKDITVFVTK
mgnify:CR=1 FL=1